MRVLLPMAMKNMVTPAMTHITKRVMRVLLPMAMKNMVTPAMTHITKRIMQALLHMAMKNMVTPAMTHITNHTTDGVGTVTYTHCFKSHVGSQQHIDITHKIICTE
jgi:hypothetical protein